MIVFSISKLPRDLQGMFWSNIGLIGGNTKFIGFRERLCVLTKVHLNTNPELTMKITGCPNYKLWRLLTARSLSMKLKSTCIDN